MSHAGHNSEIDCTCTDCKLRYPKFYHWHTWEDFKKLDSVKLIGGKEYYRDAQEILCKKYNITLVLYRTPWQRKIDKIVHIINLIRNRNPKKRKTQKLNKALKLIKDFDGSDFKIFKDSKGIDIVNQLTMSERDYKSITGHNTTQDLRRITGMGKKPNMKFITGRQKKQNMDFLLGPKRRNMSLMGKRKKVRL